LNFYIESIPSYYTVPGINDSVEDIASSLETTFFGVDIRRTYDKNSADIVITWVKDFGSSQLGHAIFKKYVEVELGSDNCRREWQAYDKNTIKKVMWHEIGHALGYSHTNDPSNIMYKNVNSQFYQDVTHSFSLEGGYSQWFPFCNPGAIKFHAASSKNTDGFNVFAIPPDDPSEFGKVGSLRYLDNDGDACGSDKMISITRYCDVGSGAYLHFKNIQSHTINITFEMYNENRITWPDMTWPSETFQYSSSYLNEIRNMFH